MPRVKKMKLSNESANISALKREPMTKFKFVIAVLWGTIAAQIFILIFTVYATIIFIGNIKKIDIAWSSYPSNLILQKVIYGNDKISYRTDEMINLDIINNANESIYLVPCQYFNKFEKKVSDKWQAVFLVACDETEILTDSASIEKISKRAEASFMAKELGEGVWRGVSAVYFGCQKAETASCKNSQIIYTNEFIINEPEIAAFSNSRP